VADKEIERMDEGGRGERGKDRAPHEFVPLMKYETESFRRESFKNRITDISAFHLGGVLNLGQCRGL
jgi:hypothetical protein